jgi:D-arabinitol 4-dehydrogenase
MNTDAPAVGHSTILHLGLGSFHRAHQAVYLHQLQELGDASWVIAAGNIRNDMDGVIAALALQRGEYTLETVSPRGRRCYERVVSIREVVPFTPSLGRLIELGADAATRIISFTVTEAGYYLDAADALDMGHDTLRGDVEDGNLGTLYGALSAILQARMQRNGAPVTLLSCDNLLSNGERFRGGLLEFLQRRNLTALRAWVEANTTCPNSMVDRITPRPLPGAAERVKAATGWDDAAPVMSETFCQWVIEDRFIAGRPAWERVGSEMVSSVHPFEEAKIRLLNATHSCLAWGGTLRGLTYIHESIREAALRQMAHDYITHDAIPCLHRPGHTSPVDLAAYRDSVLHRFSSPHLLDTNQRVASDSCAKLAGFVVPTLIDCIKLGRPFQSTALLPALFFEFLGRWHRGELPYEYGDSSMDPQLTHAHFHASDPLASFCSDGRLWGALAGQAALLSTMRSVQARVLHETRQTG